MNSVQKHAPYIPGEKKQSSSISKWIFIQNASRITNSEKKYSPNKCQFVNFQAKNEVEVEEEEEKRKKTANQQSISIW